VSGDAAEERRHAGEICGAVRFILSTPSMTGQMIALDSGQHLGWAQGDLGEIVEE
jgi:hypothetical protein